MSPEVIRNLREALAWARERPILALAWVSGLLAAVFGLALVQRDPWASTVLSASLRIGAGGLVLFHQVLLEPSRRNYPNGRLRLRMVLFVLGLVLIYSGGDLLYRLATLPPRTPPQSALLLSVMLFLAETLRLEKVLRSWLPERVQRRVQKLLHLASCRNRELAGLVRARASAGAGHPVADDMPAAAIPGVLAELALRGGPERVIGPDETLPLGFCDALRETFPLGSEADADHLIPASLRDQ